MSTPPFRAEHVGSLLRPAELAEARAKADGQVTAQERKHLQHEANRDSKAIARQKHDRQHK